MRSALASDPFAPITDDLPADPPAATASADPVPILPVPDGAAEPTFRHPRLGEASSAWPYLDASNRLLGYAARFETPEGKEVLPLTWCRMPGGAERWRWKAFLDPRPLYGLNRLAQRPDAPVLVVEGEKTADAAQEHFPVYVAITWPGGTNAVRKADWSVLKGRRVVIWPDADEPGQKASRDVALMARAAGALDVAIVQLGFALTSKGLVWSNPDKDDDELLIATRFDVLAETRDADGSSWGVLLRWNDNDGREHRLALPRSTLAGDGADARRLLLDGGLFVAPSRRAKEKLTSFLLAVKSPGRVTATARIGWHGSKFVLPDRSFGASDGEDLLLQGNGALEHNFRQRGTLEDWQHEVARHAIGNSRLVLAVSAGFAASLVGPCDLESGGVHLRGPSSTGKSTALWVAGSVWGGGSTGGYVRSWRATANGLEGVALGHCDTLLCLDELAQLSSREAGEVAYMLANGAGKSRSSRDGSARRAASWRVLFLSSGEIGLADKVAEDGRGRRPAAGQQVRILDVPADAGASLGLFEHLHGFASADVFARHLKSASASCHGTAGRAFLDSIVGDLESVRTAVSGHLKGFVAAHVPAGADGQIHRAAQRFALIAAGGELAVAAGVLPWPEGEATLAAARCFHDWISARGGTEPAEVRDGIAQVRAFLLAHGMSRFVPAWEEDEQQRFPIREIAGFRKREQEGWDYYVTTAAWRDEVCAGLNSQALAASLAQRGSLVVPAGGQHRSESIRVPGYSRVRLYHLRAEFLEAEGDA